ncbi:NAD(+) kinase, partial [Candidatus Poribacteria bacterium]
MRMIGIIPNPLKEEAAEVAVEIAGKLLALGVTPLLPSEMAYDEADEGAVRAPREEIPLKSDALIVLGGDGTILWLVRLPGFDRAPILAVNLGGLGFMTEVRIDEIDKAIDDLLSGRFSLDERMLLEAEIEGGEGISRAIALNEVAIKGFARMIHLDAYIDGEYLATYPADGILIATPSGSTAYSLSAGGPILHPNLDAILLCPICPHALTIRPFVAKPDSVITVKLAPGEQTASVIVDGREVFKLSPSGEVRVKRSAKTLKLIRSSKRSYYEILRSKLRWGERAEGAKEGL